MTWRGWNECPKSAKQAPVQFSVVSVVDGTKRGAPWHSSNNSITNWDMSINNTKSIITFHPVWSLTKVLDQEVMNISKGLKTSEAWYIWDRLLLG